MKNTRPSFSLRRDFNTVSAPQTALLVVDVQKRYCDPAHENQRGTAMTDLIARRIARIVPQFRAAGVAIHPVYFEREPDIEIESIDCHHFVPAAHDDVTFKQRDSAFANGLLDMRLKSRGIRNLLICGFNLNACVKETALDAVLKGYDTTIIHDMTGNDKLNTEKRHIAVAEMQRRGVDLTRARMVITALTAPQNEP